MTDLSPAAQAVLDAITANTEPDCDTQHIAAAALRAAADQVVPEDNIEPVRAIVERGYPDPVFISAWHIWDTKRRLRRDLLAIAAELDGTQSLSGTH